MFIYFILICFYTNITIISATLSGFYVDNGFDQTMIERVMSNQEKHEVEHDILDLLGLPNRPRKKFKSPLRKSAPRFLMDVYKSLMLEDSQREKRSTDDLNLSVEDEQAIDESDIIMTFESQSNHVSSVRHERGKRLWFNVSEVPVAENIVGAELRIYKNGNFSRELKKFTITAYSLTKTDHGERELEFVTSVNTTSEYSGWIELNMTGPLSTWVAFPESNKGLYLSVHPIDKAAHEIRPEEIGLVSTKGDDEQQPFMVAFFKATNHVRVRARRETKSKRSEFNSGSLMRGIINEVANPGSSKSCKIQQLYINFKDLKWQDWIIAPDGYHAYYCSGECRFPLNAHMNATNHAIVQTLVHLMKPNQVPKPCCAPTKLSPISVLYFLEDSNVVLKKYKKMVVKSCGCH